MGVEPVVFQCRAPAGVGRRKITQNELSDGASSPCGRGQEAHRPLPEIGEKSRRAPAGVGGRGNKVSKSDTLNVVPLRAWGRRLPSLPTVMSVVMLTRA